MKELVDGSRKNIGFNNRFIADSIDFSNYGNDAKLL